MVITIEKLLKLKRLRFVVFKEPTTEKRDSKTSTLLSFLALQNTVFEKVLTAFQAFDIVDIMSQWMDDFHNPLTHFIR